MKEVKIKDTLHGKLRLQAVDAGIPLDDVIEQGLRLMAEMHKGLLLRLMIFAEGLDMDLWQVMQNVMIADWAKNAAKVKANKPTLRDFPEFMRMVDKKGNRKVITGDALLEALTSIYKAEIEAHRTEPEDPAMEEIKALIAKGMREGKEVVLGENECCRCGAELAPAYDLRVQHPGRPPITLRLCKGCAEYVDITYGIFGMIRGKAGEVVKEMV